MARCSECSYHIGGFGHEQGEHHQQGRKRTRTAKLTRRIRDYEAGRNHVGTRLVDCPGYKRPGSNK